jgi:hypothetical protein
MTRVFVGVSCALLSVALLVYAVWRSAGMAGGMPSLLAALALMLVAVLTLRPRRSTRSSR